MSRIYFHSDYRTAELRGSERAHMGILCSRLLIASLGSLYDSRENPSWIRRFLPPDYYGFNEEFSRFESTLETWIRVSDGDFIVEGKKVSVFSTGLNTAYKMGNDAIKLCARLHGQCEIHCYVEGQNRAWLANMMEVGRQQNIFRANQGWEGVIELLRATDSRPIVTSYSVCESFPNADVVVDGGLWTVPDDEDGEENWDAWYDMPTEEQWRLGLQALRESKGGLELKPDNWNNFYFSSGITGFDLTGLARD